MTFNFGEHLKQLRKAKGFTQEEVSELLNVSKQSVSRWENNVTYPDITFLSILASFYSVTIDNLLGADYERNQAILKEYNAKRDQAHHVGDMKGAFELSKELYASFPNESIVMNYFMIDSYLMGLHDQTHEKKHYLEQSISVAERFMKMTDDIEERCRCIQYIARCNKLLGNHEKATSWLKKLPSIWSSIEMIAIDIFEGQDRKDSIQCSFDITLHMMYRLVKAYSECDILTAEERVKVLEKMIAILEIFFENGDYGFYHLFLSRIYLELAKWNDKTKGIEAVKKSIYHAKCYDSLKDRKLTSVLWKGMNISTIEFTKSREMTQLEEINEALMSEEFEFLRETEDFEILIKEFEI